MIKLEAHTFHSKNSNIEPVQERPLLEIIRSKNIIFKREQINSQQNFLIQVSQQITKGEEQQEVIYIKPEVTDVIMTDLTKIAIQEDIPELQSLEYHNRAAKLLEFFTQNQIQVQYTSVLFSKINYAIVLRRFYAQDEALGLLLDCDQILKIKGKTLKKGTFEGLQLAKIIQNKLLRLRILFQITLLFSETRRNKQALDMAKGTLKVIRSILQTTIKLYQQMNVVININKKQRANSEINSPLQKQPPQQPQTQQQTLSYPQIVEIVFKDIMNTIRSVMPTEDKSLEGSSQANLLVRNYQNRSQSLFSTEQIFPTVNNQNKLFSIIDENHPMLQMQILGLMQLTYVDLEELFPINSCEMVMAEEVILELIMLTGLSFYSISTELRFINNLQHKLTVEVWLGKALEIYYTYVPHTSAIFNQIYQVYQKLYGVDKQSIPEDEEVEYHTKLLKPHIFNNRATLSNKVVIIIKIPFINSMIRDQQQTIPTNQLKLPSGSLTAKKQMLFPQKHLITQPESEKKPENKEENEKSPKQLFIKKLKVQPQTDIKQRVDILINQILNQQAKLTQEKLKQKQVPITTLKQKYHIATKLIEEPRVVQTTTQFKSSVPASRSLSNSRKTSQVQIKNQTLKTKTAQSRYRTQINTLPADDTSPVKQIGQQASTQISSLNRQSNKYFLLRSDSAKKPKIPFQSK